MLPEILKELDKKFTGRFKFSDSLISLNIVGSRAHNTYIPDTTFDDFDIQGVFIPTPEYYFGSSRIESWVHETEIKIEDKTVKFDFSFHSIDHYIRLLTKNNPNVVALLYLKPEFLLSEHPIFTNIRNNRDIFKCHSATYNSFCGYAFAQLQRMEGKKQVEEGSKRKYLIDQFGFDTKNGAHCLRLLYMGIEYLETGNLTVYLPEDKANHLKDVKRGKFSFEEVWAEADNLFTEMRKYKEASCLQEKVDNERINKIVTDSVLQFWRENKLI